ncbi:histidine phosphatase family protein [Rhizobium herbae]|uniref:Histidine phosphatase family protein n=1 Tax=Rhizobium herbae TaxID=508661 RepID=A0ABS7HCG3_9HYPH|nr:histidine phosphatase family protein [Rhizobium herbae]MBW9064381.1 histidine phosphatase family protein [Rhizobium herbae]
MTLTIFLVRHAAHDNLGRFLAGRLQGLSLGTAGKAQALRLAQRMTREKIDAIYTSPRERTRETAEAIASVNDLRAPAVVEELDEVNFGSWSGQTFDTLNADEHWVRWNTVRSQARTPGGESMLDVQRRVLLFIEELGRHNDDKGLALISHADVIKAAVSWVLGLPIDAWPRFDIAPASITTVMIGDWGAKIVTLNEITQ